MGLGGFFFGAGAGRPAGAEGAGGGHGGGVYAGVRGVCPPDHVLFAVDNYLRICGRVKYSMFMNVIISLANIALDALLIVGLGGGIGAAALASCICLAAGSVICFGPFLPKTAAAVCAGRGAGEGYGKYYGKRKLGVFQQYFQLGVHGAVQRGADAH